MIWVQNLGSTFQALLVAVFRSSVFLSNGKVLISPLPILNRQIHILSCGGLNFKHFFCSKSVLNNSFCKFQLFHKVDISCVKSKHVELCFQFPTKLTNFCTCMQFRKFLNRQIFDYSLWTNNFVHFVNTSYFDK